jgi:hypothetical protein
MLGWTGPALARGSSSSLTLVYFVVSISLVACIVVVRSVSRRKADGAWR